MMYFLEMENPELDSWVRIAMFAQFELLSVKHAINGGFLCGLHKWRIVSEDTKEVVESR